MPKGAHVDIGLNVDYQKSLQEMSDAFKTRLTQLSNEFKKVGFSKDITEQFDAVYKKIDSVSEEMKTMFSTINNGKLDTSIFEQYQSKITKEFDEIDQTIKGFVEQLSLIDEKVNILNGADFATGIKKQFDDLRESVLSTYSDIEKVISLIKTPSNNTSAIYQSTLNQIRQIQREIDKGFGFDKIVNEDDLWDKLGEQETSLAEQVNRYKELREEYKKLRTEAQTTKRKDSNFITVENDLIRAQTTIQKTIEMIQELHLVMGERGIDASLMSGTVKRIDYMSSFYEEMDSFAIKAEKIIGKNKEVQTSFDTFQIKNGAIHVPVEVATKDLTLQKQLQATIDKLQEYAQKNSIIAKVKLVLDGDSSKGYKNNTDIAKQQIEGQNEPAIDINKAIKKTYTQAVREAEKVAKDAIKSIQNTFNESPIKVTPDKESFTKELSEMVNSSLGKIANDTSGLNVNEALRGLVASLKEVSTSLSGNKNFKFGLDEASIKSITDAIENMANMIKRAFGVASDSEIASQWTSIEEKFKKVAGEERKLLAGNKEHKVAIRELAVEYKKYLDMGGINDLSVLTSHKQTVKNITKEYENLGRVVQETVQKQEGQKSTTRSTNVDKEAIKSTTKANKNLEVQADKTSTAIENEGKSAQSASAKFRKLAKEKGTVTYANKELAKAAKETANAMELEAKTHNTSESKKQKTNKETYDFAIKARDALDKFKLKNESNSNFKEIEDDLAKLNASIAEVGDKNTLDKFKADLSDIGIKLKNIGKNNGLGKILNPEQTFADINEVRNGLNSLFATIGKVNEKSIRVKDMKTLVAEVKLANGEIHKMTVNLDTGGFARFVDNGIVQFSRLREAAESVFKGIKSLVRIYLSPQDFIRYFRQGFDIVKEVDTAMTELRKVSDALERDIASYFDDAVAGSKELGSSVNEMISATADWSRMGYNLPDAKELGELAVLYKNVGDGISVDEANSSLVSTLQGFQMDASEGIKIIDAFNEVANNYAINSAGIGEALKRSAAAFNAANTDLNQSIALITAGNEVVQNPEKIGTMWQTVSARVRGTKSELEALGETTDDVLSTSKLRDLVRGYTGVDIMLDDNTYKDMYTIIKDIGAVWKDLEDVEQAALLEALAGKKQSNTLAAVLNNAERLEEIYKTAEGSAGSAMKEQEKYTKSLQYSLDQLTAYGEEFWTTFINKDDVKTFIDFLNKIIKAGTDIVDIFGSIPTIAGIMGGFASIKNPNFGRPKMFGLKTIVLKLPNIISVLLDTKVFLWSVVKYTMVNAR